MTALLAVGPTPTTTWYLILAAVLFGIGTVGVMVRRNPLVLFMCVELMLNAANLALVTFSRMHGNLDGQIMAFFVMVVAAAHAEDYAHRRPPSLRLDSSSSVDLKLSHAPVH